MPGAPGESSSAGARATMLQDVTKGRFGKAELQRRTVTEIFGHGQLQSTEHAPEFNFRIKK